MERFKKYLKPYNIGTFFIFVLLVLWLFVFPHGMADNGDFYRAIHDLGLLHIGGNSHGDFFNYFHDQYQASKYYVDGKVYFFTTQSIFIWLSILVNKVFMPAGLYDIRFLSAIYCIIYLISVRMLLKLLDDFIRSRFTAVSEKNKAVISCILTAFFIFVFGDFGYLLYFNSFFGEPLSYTLLLLFFGLTLRFLAAEKPGKFLIILCFVTGILLIGAKQQNAPIGFFMAIFALRFVILSKNRRWRAAFGTAAVVIVVFSIVTYVAITGDIQYINRYNSITTGVMKYQKDPQDLTDLNLSPQMNYLNGTTVYERYPVILASSPLMNKNMYDRVSVFSLARYYLSHPSTFFAVLDEAADNSYSIKPHMLGNYLPSSGKAPQTQSYFFSGWSIVKQIIFPHTVGFILIFYLAFAGISMIKYIEYKKNNDKKSQLSLEFIYMLQIISLLQIIIAVLGAGEADLAKHLFLFDVTFDMIFFIAVLSLVQWLTSLWKTKK